MKIAMVSDAWTPQVNGVVRTLTSLLGELETIGHQVLPISPDLFRTIPCPTYPEIKLAVAPGAQMAALIEESEADAIHIATEGPLGFAARAYCARHRLRFTTAFHTRFPEYVAARFGVPTGWSYALLRRFHALSNGVMVASKTIHDELATRGFRNLRPWTRGVDAERFRPDNHEALGHESLGLERPIFLTVARVAVEKNLPAFLDLDLPGSK